MNPILIVQLLTTFGPSAISLIDGLIKKIESKGDVSSSEWTTLSADVRVTSKDIMLNALKQAGIDTSSPQGSTLLAAVS